MRTKLFVCFCLVLGTLQAQTTLTDTVTKRYFNGIRRNIEQTADIVPADKYSFRLTPAQMSIAEWLTHSAGRNYVDCAAIQGVKPPKTEEEAMKLKEKAEVVAEVKDSFAYCAAIIEKLDDAKILATPALTYSFLHLAVHNNEVYGNLVGYLRVSGIVPPSTAGRGGAAPAK